MKVCFLLVVATVAVLQASGEEKTPTTQGVSNENVTIELLLRRIDQLEQQVSKAEAASHVKQDSSMASKDDLEERLLKKIEELRDMLQGEIEGVQGDLVGVQSDITNVKGDITNVQGDITNVKGDITNVQGDIVDMQDKLQGEIEGVKSDITYVWIDIDDMQDKLQGEIEGVQGNITNVKGDITNVQGDIVNMKNANSALCAYQDQVGRGNNGLSEKIVVYDTTYLETNGASCSLDKSTGKFTAGKSGVYQISVSAQNGRTDGSQYFYVFLRTSSGKYQGVEAQIAYQSAAGTSWLGTPLNAIRFISLQQGETAWLEYYCNDGLTSTKCVIYKLKFCVSLYK